LEPCSSAAISPRDLLRSRIGISDHHGDGTCLILPRTLFERPLSTSRMMRHGRSMYRSAVQDWPEAPLYRY
jgi:hypothetical protein